MSLIARFRRKIKQNVDYNDWKVSKLVYLLNNAKRHVIGVESGCGFLKALEYESFRDALENAAKRGVKIQVVLTPPFKPYEDLLERGVVEEYETLEEALQEYDPNSPLILVLHHSEKEK